jgi:hypothetical protein
MSETSVVSTAVQHDLDHRFEVHGYGGILAVQARLTRHGRCSHTTWDPGPPAWRFQYDTQLSPAELSQTLKDLMSRYDVKFLESD